MLSCITMSAFNFSSTSTCHLQPAAPSPARTASHAYMATPTTNVVIWGFFWLLTVLYWMGYIILWEGHSLWLPYALHVPYSTETLTYDFIPMTGLFMLAFSFALNTDTQKPHTHVFTSHMVVIVHPVRGMRCFYAVRPFLTETQAHKHHCLQHH